MQRIEEFVDERQKAWCNHCGAVLANVATNRDHVPSKTLLQKPYPPQLPLVEIYEPCNSSFSLDEQYFAAFLGCVLSGSTNPEEQKNVRDGERLSKRPQLRARIERSKIEYRTLGGETRLVWKPESERMDRVVVKNARGHAYYEFGEPMLQAPTHVCCLPLCSLSGEERLAFEEGHREQGPLAGWAEVGSRMLSRQFAGYDLEDGWIIVQKGSIAIRSLKAEGFWSKAFCASTWLQRFFGPINRRPLVRPYNGPTLFVN